MFTLLAALAALYGGVKMAEYSNKQRRKDQASTYADQLRDKYKDSGILDGMSDAALEQFILDNYADDTSLWDNLLTTNLKDYVDRESAEQDLLAALEAYNDIDVFDTAVPDRDEVFAQAAADVEADREAYIQGINQNLDSIQQNYSNYANSLLGQQNTNRSLAMDNMQSQMRQSQQNALEAGASAGVRLANNVNILLSNQNSLRQSSIDTSNNLAQTLMSQQAQALSQRDKLLNYNADYNQRLHNTQMSRLTDAQNAYNYDRQNWQQKVSDATASLGTNPFASRIEASAIKRNQSYAQRR